MVEFDISSTFIYALLGNTDRKLYTGPMGSGKSTKLLTLISIFNEFRKGAENSKKRDTIISYIDYINSRGPSEGYTQHLSQQSLFNFVDSIDFELHIFKPAIDLRKLPKRPGFVLEEAKENAESPNGALKLESRTGLSYAGKINVYNDSREILDVLAGSVFSKTKYHVVLFEEVNLGDSGILDIEMTLASKRNYIRIYSGLDRSFRGEPFVFVDQRYSMKDLELLIGQQNVEIPSPTAICRVCGGKAEYSQRLLEGGRPAPYWDPLIIIGDEYIAVCEQHFSVPGASEFKAVLSAIRGSENISRMALEQQVSYIPKANFDSIFDNMVDEKRILSVGDCWSFNSAHPANTPSLRR